MIIITIKIAKRSCHSNRKEGNDQESIQLPNTFRSKTPKGKKDALKATVSESKHYKQKAKKKKKFSRTYMSRHTMAVIVNHSKSTALERSVKILLGEGGGGGGGGGLNRFYVTTTLALSFAVVYTRHLFSPREGFLTHQCNISENIKIKLILDEITMGTRQQEITEVLKQKKTNSWTPVGPIRARASGTNRIT